VHAAVNVGVFGRVIVHDRIDDGLWLLRRGRIIEIDERLPVDLALENRKIGANTVNVKVLSLSRPANCVGGGGHPTSSHLLPARPAPTAAPAEAPRSHSLMTVSR